MFETIGNVCHSNLDAMSNEQVRITSMVKIYTELEREPRTFIHVKRAKRFDPVG